MKTEQIEELFKLYIKITIKLKYDLESDFIEDQKLNILYLCTEIGNQLTIIEYENLIKYCIGLSFTGEKKVKPEIVKKYFFGFLKQKKILKFMNQIKL